MVRKVADTTTPSNKIPIKNSQSTPTAVRYFASIWVFFLDRADLDLG